MSGERGLSQAKPENEMGEGLHGESLLFAKFRDQTLNRSWLFSFFANQPRTKGEVESFRTHDYLLGMKPQSCFASARLALSAGQRFPNFLIILADDCTYNDLPLYGGQNASPISTVWLRGTYFQWAYLSSSMCQPCRAELLSLPDEQRCSGIIRVVGGIDASALVNLVTASAW